MSAARADQRRPAQLRPVRLRTRFLKFAEASCLIEWGHTRVLCTATVEERVPPFLRDTGTGWITAEYGMLPRASAKRIEREGRRGHVSGRTQEIQRLIGRSLRAVADLGRLGERTILIDCDVLQADGGTRCASVTGSFIALVAALRHLRRRGLVSGALPIRDFVAAASVGLVNGQALLDLNYEEDSTAAVDMNVVMTGRGAFVEVQGTGEKHPFHRADLARLLQLAGHGVRQLIRLQQRTLGASSLRAL